MAIEPLQLPQFTNYYQPPDFSVLGGIGKDLATMRQQSAAPGLVAAAFGQQPGQPQQQQGVPLNALGRAQPASTGLDPNAVYSGLVQRGLSPTAAAGVTGNLHGESALNPTSVGDGGTSFGLAQWRGSRLDGLKQFASQNGKDIADPNVQLDYLVSELKGPEARAFSGLQQAQSPSDAATAFMNQYERPAAWAAAKSGPQRAAVASQVFQGANGNNAELPSNAQPAQYQPQAQSAAPQPAMPGLSPDQAQRIGAMLTNPYTAQLGQALLAKYAAGTSIVQGQNGAIFAFNPASGSFSQIGNDAKPEKLATGENLVSGGGPNAGEVIASNTSGMMTPATLSSLAERFWSGDKSVFTGIPRGNAGAAILSQMQNAINDWGVAHGKSAQDIAFAQAQFANTTKAVEGFGVGKQGDATRAMTVAVDHADVFRNLASALANPTDVRGVNAAYNEFRKFFGSQLPTNVDAAKQILSSEIAKAVQGGDVAEGDRARLQESLKNANSWEQLAGVIDNVYTPLLAGQLRGLKRQYLSNVQGGTEQSFNQKLSPRALKVLGSGEDAPPQQQSGTPAAPPKVSTRDDANAAIGAAKAAIARGADPKAVNARLRSMGVPPIAGQ